MRILHVENDPEAAAAVREMLRGVADECAWAGLGGTALEMAKSQDFDLILLDMMLPDIDGYEVLRRLRAARVDTPILILSGLSELDHKIKGLGFGADDYLTKPFDFRELALRVEALARRPQLHTNTQVSEGHLTLDTRAKTVQWQQQPVTVTGVGFSILHKLLMEYPYPVSRSDLITHIWGDEPPESNALKSHMYSLRKALEKASGQPLLATISKIGYKLTGLDHEA